MVSWQKCLIPFPSESAFSVNVFAVVQSCKSSSGVGVLLRNSDFSDRGAGGKAAVPERDDGVCLTTVTGPVSRARKREESAVKRLPPYAIG